MIVTGASRGFGRAVAHAFGEYFLSASPEVELPQLNLRLVARSKEGLEETMQIFHPDDDRINVSYQLADLSDANTIDAAIDEMWSFWIEASPKWKSRHARNHCIFINNAGSLGYIGPTLSYPSLQVFQEAMALNVTNPFWMSARMAQYAAARDRSPLTIVNVSSLLAIQPMPTLATYSATKAARHAFHTALAQEEVISQLRVLNYAPGPLETDMARELQTNAGVAESVRPTKLLDPLVSARVLMRLLDENSFVNGAHLDYYDCIDSSQLPNDTPSEDASQGSKPSDTAKDAPTEETAQNSQ